MSLQIAVRDYLGVERADIALDPICLIAGPNEAGKSSLAEAARAVLAWEAIPIQGVAKKDAKALVRDGAENGSATAADDTGRVSVLWPKAEVNTDNTGETWCSPFAVGLKHLLDLDAKERASVLGRYIDAAPTAEDLAQAMADIGFHSKPALDKTWQALAKPGGWDETYKRAREYTTRLKGRWEAITGEKYGARKAERWQPQDHPGDATSREALTRALSQAQAARTAAIGSAAVTGAELERLRAEANAELADPAALRQQVEEAQAALKAAEAERAALPAEGKGANTLADCPACGAALVIEPLWQGKTVLKLNTEAAADEAASREVQKRRAALDGEVARLKGVLMTLTPQLSRLELALEHAEAARKRLAQIGEPDTEAAARVTEAQEAETAARAALDAFEAKENAARVHAEIVKNEALAALLAPDGLRRRKLASGLEAFNARLSTLCALAKWPAVRLDEVLNAHYGTRPVWAASGSGRWRARAVVQIAMAQIDGSAAVVLDEADILDARGRNGLFGLLKAAKVKALVCMTINKPALVPDLARAGLGQSQWIESGIAEAIDAREAATA